MSALICGLVTNRIHSGRFGSVFGASGGAQSSPPAFRVPMPPRLHPLRHSECTLVGPGDNMRAARRDGAQTPRAGVFLLSRSQTPHLVRRTVGTALGARHGCEGTHVELAVRPRPGALRAASSHQRTASPLRHTPSGRNSSSTSTRSALPSTASLPIEGSPMMRAP